LEALICLADFAHLHPEYVYPAVDVGAQPVLEAEALGHPLLPPETRVLNAIAVDQVGEIFIITGSNMAGKSTFIKTIGINLCLANSGAPVNASAFTTIPFFLHTCIRITDSLADGFSYFYAEVQCLKRLLERVRAENDPPVLFLVDEIFRGTNNRERLIGSRSYLRALIGKECVGFLATHDLELAGLADDNNWVRNYHFRDRVEAGKLQFDYRLKPGPSPTTNALIIMEMEGLPVESKSDPEK
jgi:DNA mismatch repair ATPase MutS